MRALNQLRASTRVEATPERVFELLIDVEARVGQVAAYKKVEVTARTEDGFVANFHEHYGGRDVVISSRFRFERPRWITYEHIEGPFGVNRGRYELVVTDNATLVTQTHETEQDIGEGSALRGQWIGMIEEKLEAIKQQAERASKA